jgi:hypothetical protein
MGTGGSAVGTGKSGSSSTMGTGGSTAGSGSSGDMDRRGVNNRSDHRWKHGKHHSQRMGNRDLR